MFEAAAIYYVISTVCAKKGHVEYCTVQTDRRPVTREDCISHGKILTANALTSFKIAKFKGPFIQDIDCRLRNKKPIEVEVLPEEPVEEAPAPSWWVRIASFFMGLIFPH